MVGSSDGWVVGWLGCLGCWVVGLVRLLDGWVYKRSVGVDEIDGLLSRVSVNYFKCFKKK